jgi:redox-sensitive bicupin YhaK (pirin superfamily)
MHLCFCTGRITHTSGISQAELKNNMMNKKINFTTQGRRADIGEYKINRILPNEHAEAVGPFVFLDHLLPAMHSPGEPLKVINGKGAHPHRGIATLTYILNGEAEHLDSRGHHATVHSGGAQWMKAGNGIIHDEVVNVDPNTNDHLTHALQFWINLPAKNKAESPAYLPIQANEIPHQQLADNSGWIRVIAGEYENLLSRIPNYSKQFLYHIHLEKGKHFSLTTTKGWDYAALLPLQPAVINDTEFRKETFMLFDMNEGNIDINNTSEAGIDIIVFGGEKYGEPIEAGGPFVMNTQTEIAQAYRDFHAGKYGEILYNKNKVG